MKADDNIAVAPGNVILGKYRIEAIIGRGGMGYVASARHLDLDEMVAIKVLRGDAVDNQDARSRFVREAQAAAKLKSEHVTRVLDVGVLPDGAPYIAMEFLEGSDLGAMLDENGALAVSLAVDLVLQACEGIAEAHGRRIIHRDVKPTNLFVTWRADGSPLVKLLDFGISRAMTPAGDVAMTRTSAVLGTPAYMSPEQMRSSREVDGRTDIWSLGVVLFELIQGHRPFLAESFSEMCAKVIADAPEPMDPDVSPALRAVVARCLEKEVDHRYGDIGELADALAPFVRDQREASLRVERIRRILARSRAEFEEQHADVGDTTEVTEPLFPPPPPRNASPLSVPPLNPSVAPIPSIAPSGDVSVVLAPATPRARPSPDFEADRITTRRAVPRTWLQVLVPSAAVIFGVLIVLFAWTRFRADRDSGAPSSVTVQEIANPSTPDANQLDAEEPGDIGIVPADAELALDAEAPSAFPPDEKTPPLPANSKKRTSRDLRNPPAAGSGAVYRNRH